MRHFKLNSVLFTLLVMVGVTFFMTSCSKEVPTNTTPVVTQQERIETLEADPDFIRASELNQELLVEISKAMAAKNISSEDYRNMCINADHEAVENLFAGTEISNILNELNPINQNLLTNYSDLYQNTEEFDMNSPEFGSFDNVSVESRDCGWEFQVCTAAATQVYGGCLAGVAPPDWVCSVIYAGALKYCRDKYC